MSQERYIAFISYSHEDAKWADWLHRSLEAYRVPRHLVGEITSHGPVPKRLAPVFRDRTELSTATDLGVVINEALEQSSSQLVICSPAAVRSRWVNEEILAYKRLGHENRIFCLIVAGEPNSADCPEPGLEDCFPEALRFKLGADGKLSDVPAEPIAADVRKGMDSKTDAKLKIIAGMLGLGFDVLKQRDLTRKHHRMAAIAAAATVGTFITSGLATYAMWAQKEAERQRELASFNQQQAEDLVGFMVGDMRERLEPIGRLDILDAIGDEVMTYFSFQPASAANVDMALRQGLALRQIGEIRVQQGRLADGLKTFEQAMSLLEESLHLNPDNEALLFEVSQLHFWIADAHRRQQDFVSATQRIEKYREISEILFDMHPDNPDYKMEVAWAYNNLGTLAHDTGDTDQAELMFNKTLQLQQALVNDYPGNIGYQSELAATISWLGSIASVRGSLKTALGLYQRELELRKIISSTSDDPRQSLYLASAYRWIGWTLSALGQADAALAPHREAQRIYQQLVAHDPDNNEWALQYYRAQVEFAKDQISKGLLDEAERNLQIVGKGMAAIDDDGRDVEIPRLKSALSSAFARYYLAANNRDQAIIQARHALEIITPYAPAAEDDRILIAYAEAAYLVSETTGSGDTAMATLALLRQRADKSPELAAMEILQAIVAGDEQTASELLRSLSDSEFVARYVPGTEVERWLKNSAIQ